MSRRRGTQHHDARDSRRSGMHRFRAEFMEGSLVERLAKPRTDRWSIGLDTFSNYDALEEVSAPALVVFGLQLDHGQGPTHAMMQAVTGQFDTPSDEWSQIMVDVVFNAAKALLGDGPEARVQGGWKQVASGGLVAAVLAPDETPTEVIADVNGFVTGLGVEMEEAMVETTKYLTDREGVRAVALGTIRTPFERNLDG